jgi:hypothetical protein
MQRILILLLTSILPTYCLATATNNGSFKMFIEAIALNNQISTTYLPYDGTNDMKEKYKSNSSFKFIYYPEVFTYLKDELEKQNYKVYIPQKIDKSNKSSKDIFKTDELSFVVIYYYTDYHTTRTSTICEKYIHIKGAKMNNNFETIPMWSILLVVHDESFNFQYYIPSMIKCAGDYFNKNFKGIVTCKR